MVPETETDAADESVKVILMVALARAVPVQVKLAYLLLPEVELEALTQVPAVVVRFQLVMSLPPSASSA